MARNLFSVPIFFIVFRETLEAAIIVSVLLSLVEQIVYEDRSAFLPAPSDSSTHDDDKHDEKDKQHDSASAPSTPVVELPRTALAEQPELPDDDLGALNAKRLVRKMRIQIFAGAGLGFFIAVSIGAAFIAVWFTQASDLWAKSEELWEGIFELIAAVIIFVMGVTMLKMDRAKSKWRVKLQRAFSGKDLGLDREAQSGKWVLFILPLITVLREGMEAVIFVGGVSLGQPAAAIPIAAIVGLICGIIVGYLIYAFASRATLTFFMIAMTNFILLIGAGLFSRAVWSFQENAFNNLLGADVDDAGGDGPGSFDVRGNVWHLNCCNPENNFDNDGWSIFNAIFGWTNSASVGSVLSYVFYWLAVMLVLVAMKWREGRMTLFGVESAAGVRRREYDGLAQAREAEREAAAAVVAAEKN